MCVCVFTHKKSFVLCSFFVFVSSSFSMYYFHGENEVTDHRQKSVHRLAFDSFKINRLREHGSTSLKTPKLLNKKFTYDVFTHKKSHSL